jgi:hypothetical protein
MNKKRNLLVMLVSLLALSLALIGCSTDSDDGVLTNTIWDSSFKDTDGTVIKAVLAFSGANAYLLSLNIKTVYGESLSPSQSGTYILANNTITLTATSPSDIFTDPGTLNGTISMHLGLKGEGDGDFTFTKR